jgi:site-specific DNA-methyltransferase (adenine-specific)
MANATRRGGSSNRGVTLGWEGKPSLDFRPPTPDAASALEPFATRCGRGRYFFGDNLTALGALASVEPGSATLAYLDPPFLTNRVHEAVSRERDRESQTILRTKRAAFDDRWEDRASYLEALAPRLAAARELLAPHGSIVIHVDPKTSHYVKVLCDEIFGPECFASEIVWRYRRWPSKTPNFQRVHDVLLRYRRDASVTPRFVPCFEPLAASTLATWGTKKQRAVFDGKGRRARSSSTAEETAGVPMGDVWDIGVIAPIARERTGYPSQKPEALLERLVRALTHEGETVVDPYAGSGTTLAVAARLGRRFVGADQSQVARDVTFARLEAQGLPLERLAPLRGPVAAGGSPAPRRVAS